MSMSAMWAIRRTAHRNVSMSKLQSICRRTRIELPMPGLRRARLMSGLPTTFSADPFFHSRCEASHCTGCVGLELREVAPRRFVNQSGPQTIINSGATLSRID